MSLASIQTGLRTHLATFQATNVAWAGTLYRPTIGTPYLSPKISSRTRTPVGLGADGTRKWQGTYTINVYFPAAQGLARANARADGVLAHFPPGGSVTGVDGALVQFETPTARPELEQPDWLMIPVEVPWWSYEYP